MLLHLVSFCHGLPSVVSDFLNYDDDVDYDDTNNDEPNPDEFPSLDNSGWSSRTRYS
jgi:cohesin complex subunit SCC1